MRRVLVISLAMLVVMLATRGVMAQDAEQSVSDRLLEILKERQIISSDEYGDLKGLATEMQDERAELNTRLGDLDRSITEYLAKDGDALGSNVTYQVGNGFTFATQDGRFALTIGGMFKFGFQTVDRDRNPYGCRGDMEDLSEDLDLPDDDASLEEIFDFVDELLGGGDDDDDGLETLGRRDVNNFDLDNRFHFQGHAFDPNLTFYFEFMASEGVSLFEGWVNYNYCDWVNVKGGQQRIPTGRQALIHQSDLTFGNRAFQSMDSYAVNAGYVTNSVSYANGLDMNGLGVDQSLGISLWNVYEDMFGVDLMGTDGMALEYSMGIYNGQLAYNNNWVAPAFRLAFYPFGYMPYVEGDWTSSASPKFGLGVNYGTDTGVPHTNERTSFYSWDAVMTWSGLYLTGEWHVDTYKSKLVSKETQRSWFVEAGFMVLPQELELMVRYATRGAPTQWRSGLDVGDPGLEQTNEWSFGAAYYFEGHHLKGILEIGQQETELTNNTEPGKVGKIDDPESFFIRLTFQLEW